MQTLTYGVKKPQTGDKGSVFWPALEDDLQQLNDHSHTGTDSARLTSAAVSATKANISAAGWTADGSTGRYRQLVTMPGTLLVDDYTIVFKNQAAGKAQLLLDVTKVSANTYYVYANDNTLDITAYYVS